MDGTLYIKMEKVIVNVGKTPQGYCASIDILSGWVLGITGSFAEFKKELQESIDIYIEWAKEDGDDYPSVFDDTFDFEYRFDNAFHQLGQELLSVSF